MSGFEACSAFTRVAARMLAKPPKAARFFGVLQTMSLPPSSAPTATGWSDSCRAGFAPAEEWRLGTAHVNRRVVLPIHSIGGNPESRGMQLSASGLDAKARKVRALRGRDVRPAAEKRAGPLVMHACGPLGAVEVRDGEFEQHVAKRRRVKDGGIEEGNFDCQGSIAHVQFLGVGG